MSAEETFEILKKYFETRPAALTALCALRSGVEIGITIGDTVDCALFNNNGTPCVEKRPANNPDFVFQIRPETVFVLNGLPEDQSVAEVGIAVIKEILAGNINISMPGNFFAVLRNGYLDLIKRGGPPIMNFLATQGLTNLAKLTEAIQKIKKS